jgi:hypothetical protein
MDFIGVPFPQYCVSTVHVDGGREITIQRGPGGFIIQANQDCVRLGEAEAAVGIAAAVFVGTGALVAVGSGAFVAVGSGAVVAAGSAVVGAAFG